MGHHISLLSEAYKYPQQLQGFIMVHPPCYMLLQADLKTKEPSSSVRSRSVWVEPSSRSFDFIVLTLSPESLEELSL